jgi:hypothetical protein
MTRGGLADLVSVPPKRSAEPRLCEVCGKSLSSYGDEKRHPWCLTDVEKAERLALEEAQHEEMRQQQQERDEYAMGKPRMSKGELAIACRASAEEVISLAELEFQFGREALLGWDTGRSLHVPRRFLMFLLYVDAGLSFVEVGDMVGGRMEVVPKKAFQSLRWVLDDKVEARTLIRRIRSQYQNNPKA